MYAPVGPYVACRSSFSLPVLRADLARYSFACGAPIPPPNCAPSPSLPCGCPCRSSFSLPVLRADLARYLIVFAFGGTYSDTDTTCLKPIDSWADGRVGNGLIAPCAQYV